MVEFVTSHNYLDCSSKPILAQIKLWWSLLLHTIILIALLNPSFPDRAVVEFDDHKFDMTNSEAMTLTYPEGSFVVVRRTYLPALWLQYTSSPSQTNIHFKVNRIQVGVVVFEF